MKKIIKLTCLLFASLVIVSCSKDDDGGSGNGNFTNTLDYNGEVVDVKTSNIVDYGVEEGLYNYDFILSGTSDEIIYEFYAELYSKGTESFKGGTFSSVETEDFHYSLAYIEVGNNTIDVKSGDLIVSGSGDNYSISGELTLENDELLKVSYSGKFIVTEDDDSDVL